jgi:hypothetical protein
VSTIRDALDEQAGRRAAAVERSIYYDTPAGRLLSAGTVAERAVPRGRLLEWMAWETVLIARANPDELQRRGADAAHWLFNQVNARRDAAGVMGQVVHRAVNASILGTPQSPPTEDNAPYLAAFQRFVADCGPTWEAAALMVGHVDPAPSARWAGTVDFYAEIGGRMVIGDFTTARQTVAAALKLTGLAECGTAWLPDGTWVEPPEVDAGLIVHLRPDLYPDTGYRLIPVDLDAGRPLFLASARQVHEYEAAAGRLQSEPRTGIAHLEGTS